ncbi:LysR family transcriptional regulator [Nakamurella lactea]|uniref:LysR family transcriptional regulator n=1 Tax=Nakamurella lactea TaxID=459515 RepID=UPI0004142974|nr:LysR family transcriptional regulator [Nakamurella lactea]
MDVRHLELLRELADRGSVTAVARATHRTPSAVSQQLKAAQREFGLPLAEPAGRGLKLTEAGRVLADGGRQIATAVERVRADWDAYRGQPSGPVSIAALPSAAAFLLPGVIDDLGDVPITLRCTDIDIAEAEFGGLVVDHDIVIAHSLTSRAPAGTEGLVTVQLVREPLDIAMAATHPLARQKSLRPRDLIDQEWIGVPSGFPFDTVLLAIERETGIAPRVAQRLRDNRLIESLVAAGRKIAILPRFTTPTDGGIVLRPLLDIPSGRYIFAVVRTDRAQRLAVRRVVDAFVSVAARVGREQA